MRECYIYAKEDLITLKNGREDAFLDKAMLQLLPMLPSKLTRVSMMETLPIIQDS
jgi:hypothetical protein